MRRLAAVTVVLGTLVPAADVWVFRGGTEARACAMSCAHEPGEAVCCPLEEPPPDGRPLVKSCAPDRWAALHRAAAALVSVSPRLTPPDANRLPAAPGGARRPDPPATTPDHVPPFFS